MVKNYTFHSYGIAILIVCLLFFSLDPSIAQTQAISNPNRLDTFSNFPAFTNGQVFIWHHQGTNTKVTYQDAPEIEEAEDRNTYNPQQVTACSDTFSGTARKIAKISFATPSQFTGYSSVNALRNSLPTDSFMRTLNISTAATSDRVSQEEYNDSVGIAFLYAIKREDDNDFHLIIGDGNPNAGNLLNCEVSGTPGSTTASSYYAINAARTYIKNYFGTDFCGTSSYTLFSPAIPVSILKGSIFFDVDHAAGTVGPAGFRASTAWEIHPVKNIGFVQCPNGPTILSSSITGTSYQWQLNSGSGFANIINNTNYGGTGTNTLTITNDPTSWYGYQFRCVVNGTVYSDTTTLKFASYWNGSVSTAWENTANWNCGSLPDGNTDVFICGGFPNFPIVNSNPSCRSISVTPGATCSVNAGFKLMITH